MRLFSRDSQQRRQKTLGRDGKSFLLVWSEHPSGARKQGERTTTNERKDWKGLRIEEMSAGKGSRRPTGLVSLRAGLQ